ncbi:hypothetical protein EW145_g3689 [Phellinidium pouzarii]|uniref:Uncharacterized protein n=1 Tax=Phellinidium pouzarii TaxID=167371 RepID=A0A4S4L680_9AGAM|nr:hypothetical protein EW145_g3689 [Phellinidium pouzarii]
MTSHHSPTSTSTGIRPSHAKKKRYQQPDGPLAAYIWRLYMCFSTSLALSVMEPWERVLVMSFLGMVLSLIAIGLVRYFPQFILAFLARARYYLFGEDAAGRDVVAWDAPNAGSIRGSEF